MKSVIVFLLLVSANSFAGYPVSKCPRNLESKWHCVSDASPQWKFAWPDYDINISSEINNEDIISYTINGKKIVLKDGWVSLPPKNGKMFWMLNQCESGELIRCYRISDAVSGEFIGGSDCGNIKLDNPNDFKMVVSGGNATYTCSRAQ